MNNLKCLFKYSLSILFIQMAFWGNAYAGIKEKTTIGKWSINLDKETRQVNLLKNGVPILNGVSVRFNNSSVYYNSSEYTNVTVAEENVVDVIGSARKFVIQYKKEGAPTVDQIFYVYPEEDFFMTEVYLTSVTGKKLSTNYIAPLYTTSDNQFLPCKCFFTKSDAERTPS